MLCFLFPRQLIKETPLFFFFSSLSSDEEAADEEEPDKKKNEEEEEEEENEEEEMEKKLAELKAEEVAELKRYDTGLLFSFYSGF